MKTKYFRERVPIVNGILYPDGCIEQLESLLDKKIKKVNITKKMDINEWENAAISYTVINDMYEDEVNDIRIYCGEGSYGGDGFVIVESLKEKGLIWMASFDDSNPFEKVKVIENNLYATNNLGECWQFNLNKPNEITIF